tara:strand:- start:579 stop:821 length:243 start_codon:yes stop_codon:yes gene_type:complete
MTLACLRALGIQGGMGDLLSFLLVSVAVVALFAIGPWLRVLRAKDERAMRTALPMAATGTILFLGVFVLFGGVVAVAALL